MLNSPTTLHIHRPTPTTTEFIVTTRPATLLRPLSLLLFTLKLALVASVALLALVKFDDTISAPQAWLGRIIGAGTLTKIHTDVKWWWIIAALVGSVWVAARRGYTEESVLILRGLGIQISTTSSNYLTAPSSRFIPTSSLQDIFIHEGFVGFEVRFYLCAVVKEEGETVVIFPTLLPRREILEEVWRGGRRCLYESKG